MTKRQDDEQPFTVIINHNWSCLVWAHTTVGALEQGSRIWRKQFPRRQEPPPVEVASAHRGDLWARMLEIETLPPDPERHQEWRHIHQCFWGDKYGE